MADPVSSARWHGWLPVDAPPAPRDAGAWLELSRVLRSGLSRVSASPEARFERLYEMPRDPMNATTMSMVCHFGTHVDAPCHAEAPRGMLSGGVAAEHPHQGHRGGQRRRDASRRHHRSV